MSTIIISIFLVLFVLLFIMIIVIAGRLRRDYEYKLQLDEQHKNEVLDDVIRTQEISHTISISEEELPNKVDDASVANFKIN